MFARSVALVGVLALGAAPGPVQPPASESAAAAPKTAAAGRDPAGLAPRTASYTITARLDTATRTITGDELITWRNPSTVTATSLRLHLYYNAWRNTRSSWMRERALTGGQADQLRPESDWGWIDITSLRVVDSVSETAATTAVDLASRQRFISPDDGNPDDRTVVEVSLDRSVKPGDTIKVQIGWSARVPRTFARTGVIGNFYFLAQWFPKLSVLEDTGWNSHQFHASTEFYSDFGIYDVKLTVPSGWLVGATGRETERRDGADGTTTHRYYQEDVHDFAWTTSPDYLERRARFEHPRLPAVDMRLLIQPEHAGQAERHFEATRWALKNYGEWYGPYPYGHLTIVDPAYHSGAGGMEYPTLFTAGTRWLAPRDVADPEEVTVHEAGHQFWYGIVANNEFEHAWMDEGINTFSTARTLEQASRPYYYSKRYFGGFVPWVFRDFPLTRAINGNSLGSYRLAAKGDAQSTPSWQYFPGSAGAITYDKTALWLHTLERMVGWETLQRMLSTYFSRWAFRHPRPADFFAVMNEVAERDLTGFFDQVHRSSNAFDYGVAEFRSEPSAARGFVGAGSESRFASGEGAAGAYRTTVVVRRYGEGVFPVDVRVIFDNKEEARWQWDGRERWKLFEIEKPSRARSVQVDPERVLLLDVNYTNNSATTEPAGPAAAKKWSLTWMIWLQDQLLTYGFFI